MKPPAHLSKESKVWWRKLEHQYDIDEGSFIILKTALEAYDETQRARAQLEKHGTLIMNPKTKAIHKNPAIELLKISRSQFLQAWRLLGFQVEPPGDVGRPANSKGVEYEF